MLPNFIVIGAGKCATTSLCELISQHPEVSFSNPKEPNFFSNDELYGSEEGWEWYRSIFPDSVGKAMIGEGSGRYSSKECFPKTAKRIAEHIPDCKLIYIVRHPIERIESLWMENVYQGLESALPFNQALKKFPEVYIDSSNYLRQLEHYRQYFPNEQILTLFYENFRKDPDAVMRDCFEFLGLDTIVKVSQNDSAKNVSIGKKGDASIMRSLRAMPGYKVLRHILPSGFRKSLRKNYMQTELEVRPSWDGDLKEWVLSKLHDDSISFLEQNGKSKEFWAF